MDAREYFEGVRAAQRGIDRRLAVMESMRQREQVRVQRYDAVGRGAGNTDFMGATDGRIDYERRCEGEIAALRREVAEGREVCAGVRAAHSGLRWGDVLELRYVECLSWREAASLLCVSVRQAQDDLNCALDWVDSVGIAAAKEGSGSAVSSI